MRSADQIIAEAVSGDLDLPDIKIRETSHVRITDMNTGEVTEKTVTVQRTLARDDQGQLTIS